VRLEMSWRDFGGKAFVVRGIDYAGVINEHTSRRGICSWLEDT
jgi:hypothetical protein